MMKLGLRLWSYIREEASHGRKAPIDPFTRERNRPSASQGVPLGGMGSGSISRGFRGEFKHWQITPGSCDMSPVMANQFSVDRSGRFCSPHAAHELALMISYVACLEGTDVVRLFDRRVTARREPGFVFDKACLLSYSRMSFGGGPLEVGMEEEAEKLMSQNEKDSANGINYDHGTSV